MIEKTNGETNLYKEIKIDEVEQKFSELIPTTITLLGAFTKPVNTLIAFNELEVLKNPTISIYNTIPRNKKPNFQLVEEEGIISMRHLDYKFNPDHQNDGKVSWRSRGMIGNRPFSTSMGIDFSFCHKNVSIKIFPNGKFLYNGFTELDLANDFTEYLKDVLIGCGAMDEDAEIAWSCPQTINYKYFNYLIDINALNINLTIR